MNTFCKELFSHTTSINCVEISFLADFFKLLFELVSKIFYWMGIRLIFLYQENLENVPPLHQVHLRAFWESTIFHLKSGHENNLELNVNFTDWYLARCPRDHLLWPDDHFFSVIWRLNVVFDINYQDRINTFWLGLTKTDEALIISKAAMFCMEYLCDLSSTRKNAHKHLQILGADRKYIKTRPWRWHQRRSCRDLTRLKVIVQKARLYSFFRYSLTTYERLFSKDDFQYDNIYPLHSLPWIHWNFVNYDHLAEPFYQYRGFLEYLVILLPRATKFSPLIHLCKRKAFVPMSIMFPDQSLKARQAIASYLDRMEVDIIGDTEQTILQLTSAGRYT